MRKIIFGICLSIGAVAPAMAQFANGSFETGDTTGWTTGTGYRGGVDNASLDATAFLPGGSLYDPTLDHSAVVTHGTMAHTDGKLDQVYSGNYSFRAEDLTTGGYASAIKQTVVNYQDNSIFFAWAATLEGAHGPDDAATFKILLTDDTTGTTLVSREYNAADNGAGVDSRFALSGDNFYYTTTWQIESLDVSAYKGDTFSLSLLASDCQPTAHEGTVYLDGFGAVTPPPVSSVPEPATLGMLLGGLGLMGAVARRRKA